MVVVVVAVHSLVYIQSGDTVKYPSSSSSSSRSSAVISNSRFLINQLKDTMSNISYKRSIHTNRNR